MGKIIKKRIEYGGSSNSAENIKYDDTKNAKEAIDEVKSEITELKKSVSDDKTLVTNAIDEVSRINNRLNSLSFLSCTESEYNGMATHDANTVYILTT